MDHIHIFATGGSIDKYYDGHKSDFIVGTPQIQPVLENAFVDPSDYTITPLFGKDSLDITQEDRQQLARAVSQSTSKYIVVTHGTDTLVLTGQFLRDAGCGQDKTIVLTGAMQPAAFTKTDASFNIGFAVAAARLSAPGVYLAFNGRFFDDLDTVRKDIDNNCYVSS